MNLKYKHDGQISSFCLKLHFTAHVAMQVHIVHFKDIPLMQIQMQVLMEILVLLPLV